MSGILFTAAVAGVIARLFIPLLLELLQRGRMVHPNYRQEEIPLGAGLALIWPVVGAFALTGLIYLAVDGSAFAAWGGMVAAEQILFLLLIILGMGLLGLLDDVTGEGETKGFRGHFRALAEGKLTSGALKAIGGGILALFVSFYLERQWWTALVDTMVIALSANFFNLLDLRPGRAGKAFLLFYFLFFFLSAEKAFFWWLLPLVVAEMILLPYDLGARLMLGDTGSNILGGALGLALAASASPWGKEVLLFFLVGLHFLAERYSLTKVIQRVRWLRYLDELGRGGHKE